MEVKESIKTSMNSLQRTADFAALCSFITQFGTDLGIHLTFPQLLQFLEVHESANIRNWETLHVKLLNKLKYRARPSRWEPVLARFLTNHTTIADCVPEVNDLLLGNHTSGITKREDGLGCSPYYSLDALVRTKVLLYLLEAQFDRNQTFKDKVNLKAPADLRFKPLGYDIWGRIYWLFKDSDVNLLLYREDNETDSFELLCESTDEMRQLQGCLKEAFPAEMLLADILTCIASDNNGKTRDDRTSSSPETNTIALKPEETATNLVIKPDDHAVASNAQGLQCNGDSTVDVSQEVKSSPSPKTPPSTPVKPYDSAQPSTDSCPKDILIEKLMGCDKEQSAGGTDDIGQAVKPDDETEACKTVDLGDQGLDTATATGEPSSWEKLEEPCPGAQLAVDGESVQLSGKEAADVTVQKGTKRSRRSEPGLTNDDGDGQSTVELRRSGRQRKPVVFLKMEPIQPKRSRLAQPTNGGNTQLSKSVTELESCKRSRKKKTEKSGHRDNGKKRKGKKKKRNRKGGKHSSDVWLGHSSSSLDSDEEDDYFEQVLLERERNDSDRSDDGSVGRKAQNAAWLDQPESDFNLSDISDASDTDSQTQGRNLARQKRLQRKLKAASEQAVAEADLVDEQQCQICLKSHLPEWILLCDQCDLGHHTMCLRPALMAIPEGDWYCPRCRHAALLAVLEETAAAIDVEQKKQTLWRRMQERLNFVNISMTNILADEDGTEGTPGSRRRARNPPSANNLYEQSDVSSADSESRSSQTDCSGSDDDYSEGGDRKKSTAVRRRRSPNRRLRGTGPAKRARFLDADGSSDDEADRDQLSSSDHSPEPGPRSTRQRRAQYDLKEAFKGLDEAIEEDEKYRQEKLQRQQRKSESVVQRDENESALADRSPLPPGKSRGKDLSNILGPDWRDDDDDGRPSGRKGRAHRPAGRLSSTEESADDDNDDDDGFAGCGRRKRRRDSDSDFQPASGSATASSSAEESEASGSAASGSASSDQSWLCAARRKRKMMRHSGSRRKRGKGRSSKAAGGSQRRRGRPVPRFEADDSYGPQRPRRCVRAVVSYRETEEEDEDNGDLQARQLEQRGRRGRNRQLDSDSDEAGERDRRNQLTDSDESSSETDDHNRRAPGRNQRILSSDDECKSAGSGAAGDANEGPCVGKPADEQPLPTPGTNSDKGQLVEDVAASSEEDDDDFSPSALVISETSPCDVKAAGVANHPVTAPCPATVDQDEESVEEEADDLIPRHRMFPSTAAYPHTAAAANKHETPSPSPVLMVNCPRSSPDLFS